MIIFFPKPTDFKEWLDLGDLILKAIGAVVLIWGASISLPQYRRQKLFEKELELYEKASDAASRIANAREAGKTDEAAEREFWELYWGPMCIVETPKVEGAMVAFGKALKKNVAAGELKRLSLALAHVARKAMERKFKTRLGKLSGARTATD